MKPLESYGYNAVGHGWKFILEALDSMLENTIENARANANALEQYRDKGNTDEANIKVLQVKEKFGGLRVYLEPVNMSRHFNDEVLGAVMMAEIMANRFCEMCGSTKEVENRGAANRRHSWTLTLCKECHVKRDNSFARGDNSFN